MKNTFLPLYYKVSRDILRSCAMINIRVFVRSFARSHTHTHIKHHSFKVKLVKSAVLPLKLAARVYFSLKLTSIKSCNFFLCCVVLFASQWKKAQHWKSFAVLSYLWNGGKSQKKFIIIIIVLAFHALHEPIQERTMKWTIWKLKIKKQFFGRWTEKGEKLTCDKNKNCCKMQKKVKTIWL